MEPGRAFSLKSLFTIPEHDPFRHIRAEGVMRWIAP